MSPFTDVATRLLKPYVIWTFLSRSPSISLQRRCWPWANQQWLGSTQGRVDDQSDLFRRVSEQARTFVVIGASAAGCADHLEEFYLYDTTRFADGDLSPIVELPRREELRMQNRRHYRPTVKAIQAAIAERHR